LESGLDAVAVDNGRLVYYQPDAHSYSPTSHTDADSYSNSGADANSKPGMQWGSDLDCDCDLYGRPAREPERRPL
jgi:hypothetical protein